jgi:hypothetical protein
MFHLTDQASDFDFLPFPSSVMRNSSSEYVLKQLKELVELHYSMPRRDVTDYLFKQSVKEIKKMFRDPVKLSMKDSPYLKDRLALAGGIEMAVVEYYFTGKIAYRKYSLPRKLSVKQIIKSLFPVLVERVKLYQEQGNEMVWMMNEKKKASVEVEIDNRQKVSHIKTWVFGVKFRCGKYQSRRVYVPYPKIEVYESVKELVKESIEFYEEERMKKPEDVIQMCQVEENVLVPVVTKVNNLVDLTSVLSGIWNKYHEDDDSEEFVVSKKRSDNYGYDFDDDSDEDDEGELEKKPIIWNQEKDDEDFYFPLESRDTTVYLNEMIKIKEKIILGDNPPF